MERASMLSYFHMPDDGNGAGRKEWLALFPGRHKDPVAFSESGSNRFLKDPRLYAESFFLKKESRIMALIIVMAMALLIYALAKERLREALAALNKDFPTSWDG